MQIERSSSKYKQFGSASIVLPILFILSLTLGAWAVNVYYQTLVPISSILIVVVLGIVTAMTIGVWLNTYRVFWNNFMSVVIGAGLAFFGYMLLNKTFADKQIVVETFDIKQSGNFPRSGKRWSRRCRQPYVIIDFNGIEKKLKFYCKYEHTIGNYKKVRLAYQEGLFGFPIICEQTLLF